MPGILLTGSSGYVGRVLASHLARAGIPVVGLDVAQPDGDLPFVVADVRDAQAVSDAFREHRPTHVLHLAFVMTPTRDGVLELDVATTGTRNVLEACRRFPVSQLVLLSSTSVYGAHPDNPHRLTEDSPLRPDGHHYARCKKLAEDLVHDADPAPRTVILRVCTVAGPGYRARGGVVSTIARAPVLPAVTGGDGRIQLIHEDDLCAYVARIVHDDDVSGTFNLCPEDHSTIRELRRATGGPVVPAPLTLLGAGLAVPWRLGLSPHPPSIARLMAHGIVASPARLVARYGRLFRYSTRQAYLDAVERRRALGTL